LMFRVCILVFSCGDGRPSPWWVLSRQRAKERRWDGRKRAQPKVFADSRKNFWWSSF